MKTNLKKKLYYELILDQAKSKDAKFNVAKMESVIMDWSGELPIPSSHVAEEASIIEAYARIQTHNELMFARI